MKLVRKGKEVELVPLMIAVGMYVGLFYAGAFMLVFLASMVGGFEPPGMGITALLLTLVTAYVFLFNATIASLFSPKGAASDGE